MKIAIIEVVIAGYRRNFYERIIATPDLDITIFCQSHIPKSGLKIIHNELNCEVVEIPFWSLPYEKFAWQWLPILRLWQEFDIYVFHGNPRIFSNVVWASLFKILGKPVIIWGQAHTAGANCLTEKMRLQWWRIFDYCLVYTDREAAILKEHGFGQKVVIGMNNGLDQEQIDQATAHWPSVRLSRWQAQQKIADKKVLLSSARLIAKNQFDIVIYSLPQLIEKFPNLVWCVIGDGPCRETLELLSRKLGVTDYIRWLGSIYDENDLAPWFLSSKVLVHPGAVGLTVMHAFGYGLPVVTHNNLFNQMPEIAALEDGVNGLLFTEGNVDSFCRHVLMLLEDEKMRRDFGKNAIEVVGNQFNTQIMAKRFLQVVEKCHSPRRE